MRTPDAQADQSGRIVVRRVNEERMAWKVVSMAGLTPGMAWDVLVK